MVTSATGVGQRGTGGSGRRAVADTAPDGDDDAVVAERPQRRPRDARQAEVADLHATLRRKRHFVHRL